MKVLIFSDIHGNLPAFETMLQKEKGVDQYIFLGDVVNYGPWDNECVDLLEELPNCSKILGNHEEYYLKGEISGVGKLVGDFFDHCFPRFSRMENIMKFEKSYKIDAFTCIHTYENQYIYENSKIDFDGNYFIGHSHYQFILEQGLNRIYNAGSVGQNRKFINVINYLLYYPENGRVDLMSETYDLSMLIDQMKYLKYPDSCIEYYLNKPTL